MKLSLEGNGFVFFRMRGADFLIFFTQAQKSYTKHFLYQNIPTLYLYTILMYLYYFYLIIL